MSYYLLVAVVLALDQFTKYLAVTFLSSHETLPILPGIFHFTLINNEGIAFGLFHQHEDLLLILISLSLLLLFIWGHTLKHTRLSRWGIGLILGGAIGNWIDRVRVGAVIDFLDFRVWPVFNLADTAISTGVFLCMILFFKEQKKPSL